MMEPKTELYRKAQVPSRYFFLLSPPFSRGPAPLPGPRAPERHRMVARLSAADGAEHLTARGVGEARGTEPWSATPKEPG